MRAYKQTRALQYSAVLAGAETMSHTKSDIVLQSLERKSENTLIFQKRSELPHPSVCFTEELNFTQYYS